MSRNFSDRLTFAPAPAWAERTLRRPVLRDVPAVILIEDDEEGFLVVASRTAANAISDPESMLGHALRRHSVLMALPHIAAN